MSTRTKFAELLSLARSIAANSQAGVNSLDLIEQYCSVLAEWLNTNQNSSGQLSPEKLGLNLEELTELSQLHGIVLQLAGTLLGQTATQLQDLQTRAKGIMAYVDILPKKISVTKTHKG